MQAVSAHFYDGMSAQRHDVQISVAERDMTLIISGPSLDQDLIWPLGDLRAQGDRADPQLTLMLHRDTGDETPHDAARLIVSDPDMARWIRRSRPALYNKDVAKGSLRKVARYAAIAITAAAAMVFVILPAMAGFLAKAIPLEREIAFGKTVIYQMERFLGGMSVNDLSCTDPAGLAALDKMLATLTDPQDMTYDVTVTVFDHPMVNAFAAPGGQVVILRGLLDTASGPDQVAGVLAHELGHVENRDATRSALRAAGSAGILTMLLGDVTGGAALGVLGEQVLNSSYSRDAEQKADIFAYNMLKDAQISAGGMVRFFSYVQDLDSDIALPMYLSSHPSSADREARARQIVQGETATKPSLTPEDWTALTSICGEK